MPNFILVCTDSVSPEGIKLSAETLADARLRAGRWPLYAHTPNQKRMAAGDRIAVYLGGARSRAQCFDAFAHVDRIEAADPMRDREAGYDALAGHQPATAWILLKEIRRLNPRVSIRGMLADLSFVPQKWNWGTVFVSGVRSVSDGDWKVIMDRADAGG